jgi:hypothetical protein
MSDQWIRDNVKKAFPDDPGMQKKMFDAVDSGQIEKRLLEIDKETGALIEKILN